MTEPTPDEPIDLDTLMSRDPLSLSTRDIDDIIRYFRRQRAAIEGGIKPRKDSAPGPAIDLAALGFKPVPSNVPVTRRKL